MPQLTEITTYDDVKRSFSWDRLWGLFDGDRDRMNLAHECLDRHQDQGTAISVKFADGHREHYDYATLTDLSGRFANWLTTLGIGHGDEDVALGTTLPTLVKGPMTVTGFIAYAQGWGGLYIRAHKLAYQMMTRHPGLGIPNKCGIPDGPERVHWEPEFAQKVGAPGAYDYGPERCSWLSHAMTNWIGDDGMLHKLSCEIRRHNPEGDTLFIHGTVTGKYASDGKTYVECALVAENQEGDLSARGTAVAQLPSRTG